MSQKNWTQTNRPPRLALTGALALAACSIPLATAYADEP